MPYQSTPGGIAYITDSFFPSVVETGDQRSRCWQIWFLLRPLALACTWPSSPCALMWPFLCVYMSLVSPLLSYKGVSLVGSGPIIMPSFNLDYLLKCPVFKYSHTGD